MSVCQSVTNVSVTLVIGRLQMFRHRLVTNRATTGLGLAPANGIHARVMGGTVLTRFARHRHVVLAGRTTEVNLLTLRRAAQQQHLRNTLPDKIVGIQQDGALCLRPYVVVLTLAGRVMPGQPLSTLPQLVTLHSGRAIGSSVTGGLGVITPQDALGAPGALHVTIGPATTWCGNGNVLAQARWVHSVVLGVQDTIVVRHRHQDGSTVVSLGTVRVGLIPTGATGGGLHLLHLPTGLGNLTVGKHQVRPLLDVAPQQLGRVSLGLSYRGTALSQARVSLWGAPTFCQTGCPGLGYRV